MPNNATHDLTWCMCHCILHNLMYYFKNNSEQYTLYSALSNVYGHLSYLRHLSLFFAENVMIFANFFVIYSFTGCMKSSSHRLISWKQSLCLFGYLHFQVYLVLVKYTSWSVYIHAPQDLDRKEKPKWACGKFSPTPHGLSFLCWYNKTKI